MGDGEDCGFDVVGGLRFPRFKPLTFPEFDGLRMVVVEQRSLYGQKCWYGPGRRDFYERDTPECSTHQNALRCAHMSTIAIKPMPIGSRFD